MFSASECDTLSRKCETYVTCKHACYLLQENLNQAMAEPRRVPTWLSVGYYHNRSGKDLIAPYDKQQLHIRTDEQGRSGANVVSETPVTAILRHNAELIIKMIAYPSTT